jgi:kynureninase
MSDLEFPSNMYLFAGCRRYGADVSYVPSDDGIRTNLDRFLDAIDEQTALVPLSLVLFKSSFVENAAAIVEKAHRVGARVILDVSGSRRRRFTWRHSALTLPSADRSSGCVAGQVPGISTFAPTSRTNCSLATSDGPLTLARFTSRRGPSNTQERQSGTPSVPALYSCRAGYEIVREIGVDAIRAKSLGLTRRLMDLASEAGFRINTPDGDHERGGTVTIDVPQGESVTAELLKRRVIVDYRSGAGIRMAPHFYNTVDEIDHAMHELAAVAPAVYDY